MVDYVFVNRSTLKKIRDVKIIRAKNALHNIDYFYNWTSQKA